MTELNQCLACGYSDLVLTVDLGLQPLANNFLSDSTSQENFYPLAVNRCFHCSHLQLTHVVDPYIIYKNYLYVSGTSKTYLDYTKWFVDFSREYISHWPTAVLDIGCNDGTQLDQFKQKGFITYGVDPAENLYQHSSINHKIYCDFFTDALVEQMLADELRPDIIVAQNSFAHNPDPLGYLLRLKRLMRPGSLFFVQTSQADMILNGEFDTIYHEHINFYNINSMNELCQRAGMNIIDVVKTPIHGNSYVFVISNSRHHSAKIKNLIAMEHDLTKSETYVTWSQKVNSIGYKFASTCRQYKNLGYILVGYGAAAKGNTLLNFAEVDLDIIIDDSSLKQGTYSPGRKIPVVSIKYLDNFTKDNKILFVPLAWNFFDEIKTKIHAQRNNSIDKFLRYFPNIEVE